ncbi:MAG: methylaspartate mutase accessory protein GlmL [Bacteroidota bacterium]|jgi:uncharacterized protein (TIGR01319 family)|nr:methylaspartate mutase accessory protein GlmL [Bacteroidota bacterium]HHU97225.1 DNA mismatch repair protein MutL [Petrimonas sp.]
MKYLTADFGSTYTKLTAIDAHREEIVGTATAFTTITTNVMDGFHEAIKRLEAAIGTFAYDKLLCCSSAAGGLRMVALGLVPELTAKAARTAASSAGAKVIRTFSFEISETEREAIEAIAPDLVLLCGGTDGGNREVIVSNARKLADTKGDFSIIVAGNKSAADEVTAILSASSKNFVITENVMPQFNQLNIEPAREEIKKLFIERIVQAKGLSRAQALAANEIIPTPLAVMNGCELLSKGTGNTEGIGDLMAIDIGGATTDVYSMSHGHPTLSNVLVKGLPEPYAKRSVEGDLGMRYSLRSLAEIADIEEVAMEIDFPVEEVQAWIDACRRTPHLLAVEGSREQAIEEALARGAARIATVRHCGSWESVYTPFGQVFALTGKDLSKVTHVIGIGGVIANSPHPAHILEGVKSEGEGTPHAKPKRPGYLVDKRYIFASMGLLSQENKELALKLLKREIVSL